MWRTGARAVLHHGPRGWNFNDGVLWMTHASYPAGGIETAQPAILIRQEENGLILLLNGTVPFGAH